MYKQTRLLIRLAKGLAVLKDVDANVIDDDDACREIDTHLTLLV